MKHVFVKGDRVAYNRNWLRSTGNFAGWAPFARGNIVELENLRGSDFILATVRWDKGPNGSPFEGKVNLANLVHAERIHLEAV